MSPCNIRHPIPCPNLRLLLRYQQLFKLGGSVRQKGKKKEAARSPHGSMEIFSLCSGASVLPMSDPYDGYR